MGVPTRSAHGATIAERVRALRQHKGLTQEALAGRYFTRRYIMALERGAVLPSRLVMEAMASRLDAPLDALLGGVRALVLQADMDALREDIVYQTSIAKMLIRTGKVAEAMQLIDEIETYCQPYRTSLSSNVTYLIPFLRGRAHLQRLAPDLARPELEAALDIARGEPEPSARIRNLLGVVYFELSQPRLALEQHLQCLESIKAHVIKDIYFRVNVYRNVAGDYWAMNEPRQALGIYREVLPYLDDLDDVQQKALVYWGMSSAHMALREWRETRLYSAQVLQIYETCGNRDEAASICLNLAESLVGDNRLDEAEAFLKRAEQLLDGTANRAILSFLHRDLANLALRQAQPERAAGNASKSVELAREYYQSTASSDDPDRALFWQDPVRTYAEALEMAALVQEEQGQYGAADGLFEQALALIKPEAFEETRYAISMSYADVLRARGDFRKAAHYYRVSATLSPDGRGATTS